MLVVGAGPAGLATAVSALRHGAGVLVVERRAGISTMPRATGVSTRTMELLRGWGLEERARASALPVRPYVLVSDTLIGPATAEESFNYPTAEEALAVSPTTPGYLPQDHLEPVLLEHVRERGGTVRFRTELTGLQVDEHGVRAELRDLRSGRENVVSARYLVGADGPRSAVRNALGIGFDDLGTLGDFVAVLPGSLPPGCPGYRGLSTRGRPRPVRTVRAASTTTAGSTPRRAAGAWCRRLTADGVELPGAGTGCPTSRRRSCRCAVHHGRHVRPRCGLAGSGGTRRTGHPRWGVGEPRMQPAQTCWNLALCGAAGPATA